MGTNTGESPPPYAIMIHSRCNFPGRTCPQTPQLGYAVASYNPPSLHAQRLCILLLWKYWECPTFPHLNINLIRSAPGS